jgi:hypothetical protein
VLFTLASMYVFVTSGISNTYCAWAIREVCAVSGVVVNEAASELFRARLGQLARLDLRHQSANHAPPNFTSIQPCTTEDGRFVMKQMFQ